MNWDKTDVIAKNRSIPGSRRSRQSVILTP